MKKILILLTLGALMLGQAPAAEKILFAENFSHGLSNGWENVAFFKTPTVYTVARDGTNCYARGVAEKTCSALSHKLDLPPPTKLTLRWRWKIDGINPAGSERNLKKFDHAARVFVAFDTFFGPPLTLNYLWANAEKPGTVLEHPKSGRAQIFVLESGNTRTNQWLAEERDLTADWQRAFGDKPMPKLVGIGLMTDSDSLGKKLTGSYTDIELVGK